MPKKLGKYRITVTPKGAMHGLVTFHLKGQGASKVRWFVDTRRAGQVGQEVGVAATTTAASTASTCGRRQRWGEHLWGRHTIEARFR